MRSVWLPAALTLLVALMMGGCASHREVDLSRLLRDLEKGTGTNAPAYSGPDKPESPMAPPPSALPEGTGPEGQTGAISIQPDCLLKISVEEDPSLDGNYPVNQIGAIDIKNVGPVILYNKTEKQAEEKIKDVLRMRDFRKATVKVRILRASYDRIQVSGEVGKPGVITIGAGESVPLSEALLRAGGLNPTQKETKARVTRGGMQSAFPFALEFEEYTLMAENGKPEVPNVYLHPNDIVNVSWAGETSSAAAASKAGKEIIVIGEVSRPGVYRFGPDEPCTMMHLMFKMGGLPPYANQKAVKIIRRNSDGTESEIKVNAARLLEEGNPEDDVSLEAGDRVKVPARRISLF
jgi:protein involved in polysaccharide export with SLBB domain